MADAQRIDAHFKLHRKTTYKQWLIVAIWLLAHAIAAALLVPALLSADFDIPDLISGLSTAEGVALLAPPFTIVMIIVTHWWDGTNGGGISSLARLEIAEDRDAKYEGADSFNKLARIGPTVLDKLAILVAIAVLGLTEVAERASGVSQDHGVKDFFTDARSIEILVAETGPYSWWSLVISGVTLVLCVILMATAILCYDLAFRFKHNLVSRSLGWRGWQLEAFGFYLLAWGMTALIGFVSPYVCVITNLVFGSCLLYYFYPGKWLRGRF